LKNKQTGKGLREFLEAIRTESSHIEILDSEEDRVVYAHGCYPVEYKWLLSGKYPYLPEAVLVPESTEDVSRIMALSRHYGVPVIPFGGGSGIVGGSIPTENAVMIDVKKLRSFEIHHDNCTATGGAGLTGAEFENCLNRHGYTCGHYPQSYQSAVLGGMVATRAIGTFSTRYGKMDDMVASLEVVLPDGRILQTHRAPARSSGPELKEIFLGSEGVYGVVTRVEMKIYPRPEKRYFEAYTFPTTHDGLEAVRRFIRKGIYPPVVRLYDEDEAAHKLEALGYPSDRALLFLGYEGLSEMVDLEVRICREVCLAHGAEYHGEYGGSHWFETRFSTKKMLDYDAEPGGTADAIEVAAPWDRIEAVWREMRAALLPICREVHCHFSHFYHTGASVYVIFHALADGDHKKGEQLYRECLKRSIETSLAHGGNVSHHHGIGTAKAAYLTEEHGEAGMDIMRGLKQYLDPDRLINRGVLGL
jgi:alkyldihydroxyacetonephosphate synthase